MSSAKHAKWPLKPRWGAFQHVVKFSQYLGLIGFPACFQAVGQGQSLALQNTGDVLAAENLLHPPARHQPEQGFQLAKDVQQDMHMLAKAATAFLYPSPGHQLPVIIMPLAGQLDEIASRRNTVFRRDTAQAPCQCDEAAVWQSGSDGCLAGPK